MIEGDLPRGGAGVIEVWRGPIDRQHQLERMYDVFHLGRPHGRSRLRRLRDRCRRDIVGTLGAGPQRMFLHGRPIRATVMRHGAVPPGDLTVSPALQLACAVASIGSFDLIHALPNEMSGAIWRAGFRPVGHLLRHVKLLRYRPYPPRVLPGVLARASDVLLGALAAGRQPRAAWSDGLHACWTDAIGPRMQPLWDGSERGSMLRTIRDAAMLRWCLLGLPALQRRLLLFGPGPDTPVLACETNVRERGITTATDAWSAGGVHGIDRCAACAPRRMACQAGFDAAEAHLAAAAPVLRTGHDEDFVMRGRRPLFAIWTDRRRQDDVGAAMHTTNIEHDG